MNTLNTSIFTSFRQGAVIFGFLGAGFFAVLPAAQAQNHWHWVDAMGRHVFSDKAPPANIPDKNILGMPKLPANLIDSSAADYAAADKAAAAASAAAKATSAASSDTKAKEKQEQQQLAQQRQDSCSRAKQALSVMSAGVKIAQPDGKGGVTSMSDVQMSQERKRIQDIISKDCGSQSEAAHAA